jgi:hypothetical protein
MLVRLLTVIAGLGNWVQLDAPTSQKYTCVLPLEKFVPVTIPLNG